MPNGKNPQRWFYGDPYFDHDGFNHVSVVFLKLVNPQKSCANLVILTRGSHSGLPCWSYSCVPMRLGFGGEIKLFAANQSFCWVDF